ncbi:MAG: hypothetical protein HY537_12990 [Deltaproteobacteria bacterium]|nr:hypothetical protein [Deltaproteobacteria bacterium]
MRGSVSHYFFTGALAIMALGLIACGKKNDVPVPQPAPPPSNPNPGGYAPGAGFACGGMGGIPLRPDPFIGSMNSYSGSANQLSLLLSFNGNYFDGYQTSILGSGNFDFPDIAVFLGNRYQTPTTSFCVSSNSINGGTPSYGTLGPDKSVRMILRGFMQTPLVDPFGYPGSYGGANYGFGQTKVTVSLGTDCIAYAVNGRIYGCIKVQIGDDPRNTLMYQSQ